MRTLDPLIRRMATAALAVVLGAALLLWGLVSTAAAATRTFTGLGLTGNGQGYLLVSNAGEFYAYGNAHPWLNATGSTGIVGVAVTRDGQGALAVSGSGQFYAYGTAHAWTNIVGSSGIVDVAVTADGQGALAVSRTGQFYAYGTAHAWTNIVGSTPIVGIAITADGQGALAVSDSGQFYAYGTAHAWQNPTHYSHLITSVTMTADGQGAVAMSDTGQFYAYGTAHPWTNPTGFTGSMVGVKVTADGQGLTAMSSSGQVYAYGTSAWLGNGDPGTAMQPPASSMAQSIVTIARGEVTNTQHNREVHEGARDNCNFYAGALPAPTGTLCSNKTWRSEEWCADFANWVWRQAGARMTGGNGFNHAQAASFAHYGAWKAGASTAHAKVGDAVVFNLTSDGTWASHVGLVTAVTATGITYVSGNTSDPLGNPNVDNGVYEKTIDPTTSGVSGYASPVAA